MNDPIIAHVNFTDGVRRAVYETLDGRQYVLSDDSDRVFGVWFIPQEGGTDLPVIVDVACAMIPPKKP